MKFKESPSHPIVLSNSIENTGGYILASPYIHPSPARTIDASLGASMVGGVKAFYSAFLALALSFSQTAFGADNNLTIIPNSPQAKAALEKEIRFRLDKPRGTLTDTDLERVKVLDLSRKNISDVSALTGLKKMKWLWLNNNQICDVHALKELRQLTSLHLENNRLDDASGLKNLRQLKELSINHNQLVDISALKDLKQLTYLDIGFNKITDLSALKELKLLNHLDLRNNPDLPNAQVSQIRAALPKCRIYSNTTK